MASRALPDILTDAEEERLLGAFNRRYATSLRNQLMIRTALETGARIGDLINLRWEDVDRDSGMLAGSGSHPPGYRVHIKKGKGEKDRILAIKPGLLFELEALAAKMGQEQTGRIFTTLKGTPLQSQYLRTMIRSKAAKAGIKKRVHFHLLRHTYLTKFQNRYKNIRLTQEVAGHASINTTMIYTHICADDVCEAMLGMGNGSEEPESEGLEDLKQKRAALEQTIAALEQETKEKPAKKKRPVAAAKKRAAVARPEDDKRAIAEALAKGIKDASKGAPN